jgi:hypothetical protein
MNKSRLLYAVCAGTIALTSPASNAALVTYTDQAAFMAALPGTATTLDFESVTAPFIINSGDTLDGITFNYNFGPGQQVDMQVSSSTETGYATTSGTNFLGTTDADIFLDGDDFTMDFAAASAIGLYIITAETPNFTLFDDDIQLTAGGGKALLDVDAVQSTLSDDSLVYFIGLINTTGNFTTASLLTHNSSEGFLYNIDDITTSAVPLPGAFWLFGSGLAGLIAVRRRRK